MRIFVTGASGWIGTAVVGELLAHGHDVTGLARSDRAAAALEARGARARRGDLDDPDSLRAGAADADAVVHLANKHDFAHPEVSNRAERAAVRTLGDALAGSGRPLLIASGTILPGLGRPITEDDRNPLHGPDAPRGGSENLLLEYADRGVRPIAVRFPPTVHGAGDHGFVATLTAVARERGVAGYVGEGSNRWAAVHRSDAAAVVRLALEQAGAGPVVHAVAEEGVPAREIAAAIGRGVGVPVRSVAAEELGWIGAFFAVDGSASSAVTQRVLGWTPKGPTLAEDLAAGVYFRA